MQLLTSDLKCDASNGTRASCAIFKVSVLLRIKCKLLRSNSGALVLVKSFHPMKEVCSGRNRVYLPFSAE